LGGGQRLVPVLLGEVGLPPFVASRVYLDFRSLDSPAQYRSRFEQLLSAVRGEPSDRRPSSDCPGWLAPAITPRPPHCRPGESIASLLLAKCACRPRIDNIGSLTDGLC